MSLFIVETAAATAAGFALLAAMGGSVELNENQIFGYCAAGSVAGSFMHILRVKLYNQDGMMFTFLLNAGLAGFFGPPLCDVLPHLYLPVNARNCSALACALGFGAPWILTELFPILGKKLLGTVRGLSFRSLVARVMKFKE